MSFSTIIIVMFMVMFWIFRAIVTVCTQYSIDLNGVVAYNMNLEIIISFIVLLCILLVIKRKLIGGLVYVLVYGLYYGEHFVETMVVLSKGAETLSINLSMNLICDFIAIILAFFCIFDLLVDKNRKANPKDRKTDWYFNNKEYDDELAKRDDREDKNEYKFF